MNGLFAEIAKTNQAYCASLGLSSAEMYGKTLSEPELERALVIDLDLSRAVAEETKWLMRRGMAADKAIRWAEINIRTGVSNKPHAVIEYAQSDEARAKSQALFATALGKFYSKARQRPGVTFIGD